MLFYTFNVAVIVGVGFLVVVLRFFVREAIPRHAQVREKSRGLTQPLEVLRFSGSGHGTTVKASGSQQVATRSRRS